MKINDRFWNYYRELVRTRVVPYQWEALNDRIEGAEPSYCIANFKKAAGGSARTDQTKEETFFAEDNPNNHQYDGEFRGCVFQDSDVAKWLEAASYTLCWNRDEKLEEVMDRTIDLIADAQQADGYLNTYYILNGLDKRFTNLRDNHELYCLGHFIEAAVAYYEATGKRKLLDCVQKYVELVDSLFGPEDGKRKGYPGHEEIELALLRLYHLEKEEKYRKLAAYFLSERGKAPIYFEEEAKKNGLPYPWKNGPLGYKYCQADRPITEQTAAEGHAVRAVYLYTALADAAAVTGNEEWKAACRRIWDNLTRKQMYITGAIGSSAYGEAFTFDYDLPNDTVYGETCASIGLVFFADRMLKLEKKSVYADVMERALYNGILSGISVDGTKFFYVNPLEVHPEACEKDHGKIHVKVQRQKWFGCACCPPNIARLIASLDRYVTETEGDVIYQHLYMGCDYEAAVDGKTVGIHMEGDYLKDGNMRVSFRMQEDTPFAYAFRKPGWCSAFHVLLNGKEITCREQDGYLYAERIWSDGDVLELGFHMPVVYVQANCAVSENIGKIAVMRGPLVYCMEETDNGRGLSRCFLKTGADAKVTAYDELLEGMVKIHVKGSRLVYAETDSLYMPCSRRQEEETELCLIPYFLWANREAGEMLVWIHEKQ